MAAREILGVKPIWNRQFDVFTGISKESIQGEIDEVIYLAQLLFRFKQ